MRQYFDLRSAKSGCRARLGQHMWITTSSPSRRISAGAHRLFDEAQRAADSAALRRRIEKRAVD